MINIEEFQKISSRIDTFKKAMIQLQIDLCSLPALSPENGGDGEWLKAIFLRDFLIQCGFVDIHDCPAPDDRVSSGLRPNIFVRLPGKKPEKTVWILTHMDIVPPGEISLWNTDPYRGTVHDGHIYGRGTEDNQQDLVASIFAALAFLHEKIQPEHSIGLALVADEETSSRYGVKHLLDQKETPFRRDDLIVVPDFGDSNGMSIEVAEKSILWIRCRTTGRQCHGSRPDLGRNAFVAASHLVVRLHELYDIFPLRDSLYQPQESTFEPTKKEANVPNVNTIPGEDVFYLDGRILPAYPLKSVLNTIRSLADEVENLHGVHIQIESVQEVQAPPPTPIDAPVVGALSEAIEYVYNVQAHTVGIGAGTVAALLRQEGYPVAVWSKQNETAHQPNENCLIANMIGNAKVYAYLFLNQIGR